MKNALIKLLPWIITLTALYLAFSGIDLSEMKEHLSQGKASWLALAVLATVCSYLLRSWRWIYFFPQKTLDFLSAFKVLILGFFMNNILPARAGELVRAHMGAKISNTKRTLVLATIASERLADGVVLSAFFLIFALSATGQEFSGNLLYVASLFFVVSIIVLVILLCRKKLFALIERLNKKVDHQVSNYAVDRIQVFVNGLKPLFMPKRFPILSISSLVVWSIELLAYYFITRAFNTDLSLSHCVLFLVAVNFSSLIPAAPAGLGVIEAIATAILVTIGLEKELALSMVISQHLIQFLVVGIPGLIVMLTWKKQLKQIKEEDE